jgi:hypothetical protein
MVKKLTNQVKYDKTKFSKLSLSALKARRKDAIHLWSDQIFRKASKEMSTEERQIWLDEGRSWQFIIDDLNSAIKDKTPKKYPKGTIGYAKSKGLW